jgi:hypothetical protein
MYGMDTLSLSCLVGVVLQFPDCYLPGAHFFLDILSLMERIAVI